LISEDFLLAFHFGDEDIAEEFDDTETDKVFSSSIHLHIYILDNLNRLMLHGTRQLIPRNRATHRRDDLGYGQSRLARLLTSMLFGVVEIVVDVLTTHGGSTRKGLSVAEHDA